MKSREFLTTNCPGNFPGESNVTFLAKQFLNYSSAPNQCFDKLMRPSGSAFLYTTRIWAARDRSELLDPAIPDFHRVQRHVRSLWLEFNESTSWTVLWFSLTVNWTVSFPLCILKALAFLVILSPIGITYIFTSWYSCCIKKSHTHYHFQIMELIVN